MNQEDNTQDPEYKEQDPMNQEDKIQDPEDKEQDPEDKEQDSEYKEQDPEYKEQDPPEYEPSVPQPAVVHEPYGRQVSGHSHRHGEIEEWIDYEADDSRKSDHCSYLDS